jgi:hypothetical protein
MKRFLAAFAALFILTLYLNAQDQASLTASDNLPKPDGVVNPGEYQYDTTISGMTLGVTLGDDGLLYLSIQAKTAGWVALGVGGKLMNGSRLFLAYDTGSKQVFNEQRGAGHFHADLKDPAVSKWAVKQDGDNMTLELVLPASAAVVDGSLDLLFAYADTTSFMVHHKARGALSFTVKD